MPCSFCGKTDEEVLRLIDGPAVRICCECVTLMYGSLTEPERAEIQPVPDDVPLPEIGG